MSARDRLADHGVFGFSEADPGLHEFVDPYRARGMGRDDEEGLLDLVALAACEFGLLRIFLDDRERLRLPVEDPLQVVGADVDRARLQADCSIYNPVHWRKAPDEVRVADVLLFAGDMSRLRLLRPHTSAPELAPELPSLAAELEYLYREGDHPLGRAVAESGLARLQGLIWTTRHALVTSRSDVEAVVDDCVVSLGISEGRAAGAGT
jgi:hypothetical protein